MKFLKSEANKQHAAHPNIRKNINKFCWHVKVGKWIGPSHLTVRLFVAVIACTRYSLFQVKTLPYFNVTTFHAFV
jgi:hypothetical protein